MKEAKYLDQRSQQTIREAVRELRVLEGDSDAAESLASELSSDIEIHDAIHVLFGCQTGLEDEVIAHLWTALGTTYRTRDMVRVNMHRDHREVLRTIGHARLLKTWIRQLPRIAKTIYRARKMKSRFPIHRIEDLLDRSLAELRSEYGIQILRSRGAPSKVGGAGLRKTRTA